MMEHKGRFIAVSGGEGAGKTSQIEHAKIEFGDRIVCTREPGGTPSAEKIREFFLSEEIQNSDVLTRMLLMFAMRRLHAEEKIRGALKGGKLVICDRSDSDTFAYQIRAEDGKQYEKLFWQLRESVYDDIKPDLYVHFDIEPSVGIFRKLDQSSSEQNTYDQKPLGFHDKVHEGLKEFMGLKDILSTRIDASQGKEEVWHAFREIIEGQLRFLGH